ncbi:unnamed protein product [Brassica rapa subsp. trilocularis]
MLLFNIVNRRRLRKRVKPDPSASRHYQHRSAPL